MITVIIGIKYIIVLSEYHIDRFMTTTSIPKRAKVIVDPFKEKNIDKFPGWFWKIYGDQYQRVESKNIKGWYGWKKIYELFDETQNTEYYRKPNQCRGHGLSGFQGKAPCSTGRPHQTQKEDRLHDISI